MSVLNQNSDDEPLECPLCMEYLELDDVSFYPCSCGYQICRFCWNKIRTEGNGNCPACRSAYAENPADFKPLTAEEMAKIKAEKRQKDQAKKQKISENRKHLANVRVVQKNLVFVVGLSPRLSDAEVLRKPEYFGKFGKMHKVVINLSTAYAGNQNQGPSASAYVTYYRSEDALRAIQAVSNIFIDGRTLKASLGTTKYCSHFMKNQPCPKPDCMYLHELGDEAASFTKEEMQQGKHTEYEKHLHEEMLLNQSTAPSDSPSLPGTENRGNQNLSLPPEKLASQNNSQSSSKGLNSISPITVGGIDLGTALSTVGVRSEVTGGLPNNGTSMGNGSDFTHTVNNTGQGGMPQNKDILDTKIHNHHHNSTNIREQHTKGSAAGTMHKNNSSSHCTNIVSSRTPSPKSVLQNGHIDRVGGAVSSTATGMSSTSCGSVGSTTSSSSNGSSSTSINSSSSGGSGVGLWQNIDRSNNSTRKWNDSPDSLRECNSQTNNDLDSHQSTANQLNNISSISNDVVEHYRSNQTILSNLGSARNRADTSTEQAPSYFSNNLDNIQNDQQQQVHRTNESSNSKLKGWSSSDVQQVTGDSRDDLFAEDDLGFDPFHETQKALAEMLESESKLQNIYTTSPSPHSFTSNQSSQQQTAGNLSHQLNGPSQHPTSSPNNTSNGMPNLPPGLPSSSSSATTSSSMNSSRLPLKQPPPGFGHQSLLSQESHSFGMGPQNSGPIGDSNFQNAVNQHPYTGQQNDFLGRDGFSNPARSGLRNISGSGPNGSLNFSQHSNNHVQTMQHQMNHNPQHASDHQSHRLTQQPPSSSGNISNVDHLQQQLRQLSFEKQNFQHSKDWQEGLRALLPNVNVSFGALPNNGGGFSGNSNLNSNQSGHSHADIEARFNHSQHQSANSNNHLLNDHSPHNMMNPLQQNGQNMSHQTQGNQHPNHMNHLNHHSQHQPQHMNLQHQQHNERQQLQQHRSHSGWGNMAPNDWTVLDPAIVSGQLSDHNVPQSNGPMPHGVNGPMHGSRSDSPPHWIKANLEQLTADTNISTNQNREYSSGQNYNISQLLSGPPNNGLGGLPSPNNASNSNSAVQAALAGWSGQPNLLGHNTPPPGFMSRGTAAPGLASQNGPMPQHHPFQNMASSNGSQDQLESEFQRLIHSK